MSGRASLGGVMLSVEGVIVANCVVSVVVSSVVCCVSGIVIPSESFHLLIFGMSRCVIFVSFVSSVYTC